MKEFRCLAGIVLFNPDTKRLAENIEAVSGQCTEVLLIDNGSDDVCETDSMISKFNNVTLIKNGENLGIAKALNKILDYALAHEYDWFLSLDQDSICAKGLIPVYAKYVSDNIGQLTCNIADRNVTNASNIDPLDVEDDKLYKECEACITSGAFNNTKALAAMGGATERLFIDGVDLDLSMKLRKAGYRIVKVEVNGLLHELGKREKYKLFGKTM